MDIPPSLAAQVGNQYGLFTAAQALEAGFDHEEIRRCVGRGDWFRVRRGIYCEASTMPAEPMAAHIFRVRAAMLRLKPPVAVSHLSAAAVETIDLLDPDFSMIHVTRPNIGSSRTDAGIHHHNASLLAHHVKRESGLVITTASRTVVDLAREATFEQGVVAAEHALHKGLVTRAGLLEVHTSCLDWHGSRNAGRVIQFASDKSESPGESLTRIAFEAVGLPAPKQQVKVHDRKGLIGIVDFLWEKQATIGEFDGRLKYTGQPNADVLYEEKRREDRLRALGFEVVRFGYHAVRGGRVELNRAVLGAFARSAARRSLRKLGQLASRRSAATRQDGAMTNLLGEPPATLLPDDPDARAELEQGIDPTAVAAAHPSYAAAWAELADRALAAGEPVAAYAYARTGYHRSLDQLRRAGWKGHGPVPWEHEPNQGFLRSLNALGLAAAAIGEEEEAVRCADFLRDSSPSAVAALAD